MSLFASLPLGPPTTVHAWAAFRDLHRADLSGIHPELLATLYGFSWLPEYRDDDCLKRIEAVLDRSPDPLRARYLLACYLGEQFGDEFSLWSRVYTPEELAEIDALEHGKYGPYPNGRWIQPDEPGYVSEIPAELHTRVVAWLVEGIKRFRNDEDLFQHIRTIAARRRVDDTFLDEADLEQLRHASGDELSLRTDLRAQASIREMTQKFNETFGRNEHGTPK